MSDIAERLKKAAEEFSNADSDLQAHRIRNWIRDEVMENLPVIISTLQFADDMQRLIDLDVEPEFQPGRTGDEADVVALEYRDGNMRVYSFGKDIFTAVRNAVEQMEGK